MAKFLFFCPEGYIKPHLALMAVTARTMRDRGHEAHLTSCFDLFPRCVPKSTTAAVDVPRTNDLAMCGACSTNTTQANELYGVPLLQLAPYVTPSLRRLVTEMVGTASDLPNFEYEGERIGLMAAFLYTLRFKSKPSQDAPPERLLWYRQQIATTLMTFMAVRRLLDEQPFTHLVVFNFYPPNMAAMRAAYRRGIEVRILSQPAHRGIDRRFAWVMREEIREYHADLLAHWQEWRRQPISADAVREIALDTASRLATTSIHTYSPGKTLQADYRQALDLPADKRIIAVYSSSPDEPLAADFVSAAMRRPDHSGPEIFQDEIAWLLALRDFAAKRRDLCFLVRMHPRLDGNRREPIRSPHLDALRAALDTGPANWRVFWPQDPVSSYDILEIADLVLTLWSTISLEAARVGIPALMAFWRNRFIPYDDFIAGRKTVADYFAALETLIGAEADLDRIVTAYRYHYQVAFSSAVSLADVYPSPDFAGFPPYRLSAEAPTLERALLDPTPLQHHRLANAPAGPDVSEREAMKVALSALLRFYLMGQYHMPPPPMEFRAFDALATAPDSPTGTAFVAEKNNVCLYREGQTRIERYSAVAGRLIRLLAQETS